MEHKMKIRYNSIGLSSIDAFQNVTGGMKGDCKEVCFVRALGVNATYLQDIEKMDTALITMMNEGKGYYLRINELPKLQEMNDISFYSAGYDNWINGNMQKMVIKATQTNEKMALVFGSACKEVAELFKKGSRQISDSMIKNYLVKLLFWYDALFGDDRYHWTEQNNVKIVAAGVEKKTEYLFFYLLTQLGYDVLLLQNNKDIGEEEESFRLSAKFVLGEYKETVIPPYVWRDTEVKKENKKEQEVQNSSSGMIRVHIPQRAGRSAPTSIQSGANGQAPAGVQSGTGGQASTGNDRRTTTSTGAGANRQAPTVRIAGTGSLNNTSSGAATVSGSEEEKSFEALARLASSIVMISVFDDKGERIKSGSGIMIGKDGYILTNNHVACGGKYYTVRIEDDEKEYKTDEVIKYHSIMDLAVIRIQRKLTPLPIYKGSKPLVRGQKVVAIGSPLGFFNSVSNGIISGFRQFEDVDMIQFTAPISRGSSGGAVLNMQGEVIGISTLGFDDGQNINMAMGYECINMFVRGFI